MRTVYEDRYVEATNIQRNILQGSAKLCSTPPFAVAWKALFPHKSAEELASRAGMSVRAAAYELSGESELSAVALCALIDVVRPHRKRRC